MNTFSPTAAIKFVGILALFVGLLAAVPVVSLSTVYVYKTISQTSSSQTSTLATSTETTNKSGLAISYIIYIKC